MHHLPLAQLLSSFPVDESKGVTPLDTVRASARDLINASESELQLLAAEFYSTGLITGFALAGSVEADSRQSAQLEIDTLVKQRRCVIKRRRRSS